MLAGAPAARHPLCAENEEEQLAGGQSLLDFARVRENLLVFGEGSGGEEQGGEAASGERRANRLMRWATTPES